MRILVDMDDCICGWWDEFSTTLTTRYPHLKFPFIPTPLQWDLTHGLDAERVEAIADIRLEKGFFRRLKPYDGARQALNAMIQDGHEVFIVTTPEVKNPTCASDKLEWLARHIGEDWPYRAILTQDKTLVHGDILIDDRPDIRGSHAPSWRHVLFTSTHNHSVNDHRKRLNHWADWRSVITG